MRFPWFKFPTTRGTRTPSRKFPYNPVIQFQKLVRRFQTMKTALACIQCAQQIHFSKFSGAQQFDQYGKVFTLKLQYIFYKERPGIRPGQIGKAGRLSDKLTQFAVYAIQGDYSGVKEFGSDLKKLGAPIEHSPQV